ncbi:MAG: putative metal-binding motif-containing protein, partial [Persicimonas sp.]
QGSCKRACEQGWADANEDWLDAEDPTNSDGCELRCEPTNGGEEICDGRDNDCDGDIDEGLTTTYYLDEDDDGYGVDGDSQDLCEPEDDYRATQAGDCDDTSASINPDATESCNGFDDDCDGDIDEDVEDTFYADNDGDGYGDASVTTEACEAPDGYVTDNTDCDDSDADKYPGNSEVCDGKDNNCDGDVDEGVKNTFYADSDGDNYGDPNDTTQACSAPSGYVDNDDDCDDSDADIKPGASEVCDGVDNDCDGDVDEGLDETFYADSDGDGYGDPSDTTQDCSQPSGYVDNADDCDDTDAQINPGAAEVCDDQIDNDCDGLTDCEDGDCDGQVCGDGGGGATCHANLSACVEDVCDDDIDNDLDGDTDCSDDDCANCDGDSCNDNSQCVSGFCSTYDNTCYPATCDDGSQNGTETDVDCGGECAPCDDDQSCSDDSDCKSDNCNGTGVCKP